LWPQWWDMYWWGDWLGAGPRVGGGAVEECEGFAATGHHQDEPYDHRILTE